MRWYSKFTWAEYAIGAVENCSKRIILAGGALRDFHAGIRPKDLDIFAGPDFDPRKIKYPLNYEIDSNEETLKQYNEETAEWEEDRQIKAIYNVSGEGEFLSTFPSIQVIVMRRAPELIEMVRSFDLNVCQIGIDPDGLLFSTKAFRDGMAEKIVRYSPHGKWKENVKRSKERARRIARNLGFTVNWASFRTKQEIEDDNLAFRNEIIDRAVTRLLNARIP